MYEKIKEFMNTHIGFGLDKPATDNDVLDLLDSMQLPENEPEEEVLAVCRAWGCPKK